MSWVKFGTLLALPGALLSILSMYMVFKDDNKLEADLSYQYDSAPRLFTERLGTISEHLKYTRLYDDIKNAGNGALSHEQINKIVDLSQAPYLALFEAPFERGPDHYPVRLVITLRNTGSKVIKEVHVKLPAKGVVQIRDDSRIDTLKPDLMSSVEIPAIVQNGVYRIWVYFQGDLETLREKDVHIGYSDGVAQVRVSEDVIGLDAYMARYGVFWLAVLTLVYLLLVAIYMLISAYKEDETSPASR
ncbi:hypothetical protein ACRCF9_03660 [Pseudomonas canadensis]|uniref:hypothetical protein n=1 Tax=Pseudomonas TaxID=286 RepID=UPI0013157C07|nr:hypothetical protein [Pseudomonas sp. C 49-2]